MEAGPSLVIRMHIICHALSVGTDVSGYKLPLAA